MTKRMESSSTQKSAISASSKRPAMRRIVRGSAVAAGAVDSDVARRTAMVGFGRLILPSSASLARYLSRWTLPRRSSSACTAHAFELRGPSSQRVRSPRSITL